MLNTIVENREVFIAFLVSLLAIIKLTAWGRARAAALDAVVNVIESLGAREVKNGVVSAEKVLSTTATDALRDSVAKADPKKTPQNAVSRFVKEVFRWL